MMGAGNSKMSRPRLICKVFLKETQNWVSRIISLKYLSPTQSPPKGLR